MKLPRRTVTVLRDRFGTDTSPKHAPQHHKESASEPAAPHPHTFRAFPKHTHDAVRLRLLFLRCTRPCEKLISGFFFACLAPLCCIPSSPTYFLSARIPSSVGLHRGGASDHTALPRRRLRVRHAARLRAPACPCLPRPQLPLPVVCYLQRPVGRAIRGHALDCAEFAESRLRPRTSRAARVCRLPDSAAAIWRFSARHVTRQRVQTARTLGLPRPALLNRRRRPAAGSPAGNQVEHAILPVRSRHISITFRRLRRPAPARERDGETPR